MFYFNAIIMQTGEIIIYQAPDGQTSIDVKLENETLWLSLNAIATLFERDKSVISRHIKKIYADGELEEKATVAKKTTVQKEGKRKVNREIELYNLDVILSVGYTVNSIRGTQFRIWANKVLKDYLVKGYAINEKRLKDQSEQFENLIQIVKLLGYVVENITLNSDEAAGLWS